MIKNIVKKAIKFLPVFAFCKASMAKFAVGGFMDIRALLSQSLPIDLQKYSNMIVSCQDSTKGDYTIPCFALAK